MISVGAVEVGDMTIAYRWLVRVRRWCCCTGSGATVVSGGGSSRGSLMSSQSSRGMHPAVAVRRTRPRCSLCGVRRRCRRVRRRARHQSPHLLGLSFGAGWRGGPPPRGPASQLVLALADAGWAGSLPADVVTERVGKCLPTPTGHVRSGSRHTSRACSPAPSTTRSLTKSLRSCAARPAGIKPMVRAFAEADLRSALGDSSVPTLLLSSELDERAPRGGLGSARPDPRSTLTFMPGVGHCTNVEAPALFNDIVRHFLTP